MRAQRSCAADGEYGNCISGNCLNSILKQKIVHGTVVLFPGNDHDKTFSYTTNKPLYDDTIRSLYQNFLATPTRIGAILESSFDQCNTSVHALDSTSAVVARCTNAVGPAPGSIPSAAVGDGVGDGCGGCSNCTGWMVAAVAQGILVMAATIFAVFFRQELREVVAGKSVEDVNQDCVELKTEYHFMPDNELHTT